MTHLGQRPVPTRGHPSATAAVRHYDAHWPGAPVREVAWMLGLAVREVHLIRAQDRYRGLARRHVGKRKSPVDVMRDVRDRRRANGVCIYCGDDPPAAERDGCDECLKYNRERVARSREEGRAA